MSLTEQGNSRTYGGFVSYGSTPQQGAGVGRVLKKINRIAHKIGDSKIISNTLNKVGDGLQVLEVPGGAAVSKLGSYAKQAGGGKRSKRK